MTYFLSFLNKKQTLDDVKPTHPARPLQKRSQTLWRQMFLVLVLSGHLLAQETFPKKEIKTTTADLSKAIPYKYYTFYDKGTLLKYRGQYFKCRQSFLMRYCPGPLNAF